MASPHQPIDPHPGGDTDAPPAPEDHEPRVIRLRLVTWDVICTVALLTVLFVVAVTTSLPSLLFGFFADVCTEDTCGPVPYGVGYYIFPVAWGGIGAACAAAIIGPFVSLIKGWYMFFWPLLAAVVVMLTSLAGFALTAFSEHYWH